MTWGSTHKLKLHKIDLKRKHSIRLICSENKFTHNIPLMRLRSLQVLDSFQINIRKILVSMHLIKACSDIPNIFGNKFTYPFHRYPTNFSKNNFALSKYLSHKSKI